ncbi:MAG TPA: pirin family protein [Hyphomicrobiales bacterium]|nr:pirin family protein [Hyphomicrobiales bacterium]
MSWQQAQTPQCIESECTPVETVIVPRVHNIGDFDVRRALPAKERQMIGPFIFFDQMGPVRFQGEQAIDVRPHPHIGLSTLTWLFEGEVRHQDSLGYDMVIRPGEVNWMTAGSGIVHSERSPASARGVGAPLAGIQTWMALPLDKEEIDPAFYHYTAAELPRLDDDGVQLVLIAGNAFGEQSGVRTESPTFYAELRLAAQYRFVFPQDIEERGVYVYAGSVEIGGSRFEAGTLVVLKPNAEIVIRALADSLCMLLGGDALEGHRHMYWNFVSSSRERIEQAKQDWVQGRFAAVAGDPEFIPLPGT